MSTSSGANADSAGYSMFLLQHPHHRYLPLQPVSTDGQRQFVQLFQHADRLAVAGRPSNGALNEVERLVHSGGAMVVAINIRN